MRERREDKCRDSGAAVSISQRWWKYAARRPIDSLAVLAAVVTTVVIVVNAVFMQAGAQPAPFVAAPVPPPTATSVQAKAAQETLKPNDLSPARIAPVPVSQQAMAVPMPVPSPARRNDPIAELIGSPSPRIQAVQRVLSEFGYGQLKPNGVLDNATSSAISKFEHEHKLPATGRVSDKLVNALGTMAGHPIE